MSNDIHIDLPIFRKFSQTQNSEYLSQICEKIVYTKRIIILTY
jgi:hypothetical protein